MENKTLQNGVPLLEKKNEGIDCPDFQVPQRVPQTSSSKVMSATKSTCSKICSKSFLYDRLPFLSWGRTYDLEQLTGDLIAGVTTALTVIPQGIGYAPLAGLPLQYGLYASIVPGFMYCLLGTTKQSTVGPTAVNSLMSYNYAGGSPYKAVTLAFFAGLIEIMAGILNLGFLIQYISGPVISAFSSAVSIQVITSQVKGFFGIYFPGRGFIKVWIGIFKNISSIQPYDTAVGFACMAILYFLRRLKEFNWCEGPDKESTRAKVIKKTKWLLSISANCLVVVLTSLVAWLMVDVAGIDVLNLTGEVDQGLPAWQLPWEFNRNATINGTSEPEGPVELASELGIGLLMLPMVSILQHLAIAKHYAGNRKMAASQEMIALGFCQFVGSFTGSMAVTASFGRSAVNATSGVRTPFGGVFTGIIIILACAFLSPYLAFIPTSALSAVIIFAMFYTIDYNIGRALWKAKKIDLIPYTLTFLLGLFVNVETGLIVGCLVHVGLLLYSSSSPALLVEHHGTHTLLQPQYSLFFPSVDHIRGEINTAVSTSGSTLPVVIDMTLVKDIDYTAAKGLCALVKDLKKTMTINIVCTDKAVSHVLTSVYGSDLELSPSIDDAVKLTVV